jgi:hypothetical protein
MAATETTAIIDRLERFAQRNWRSEPGDITRLRTHSLPPMGNLPPVLYANFNTFWMGENIQVVRQLALDKSLPPAALNQMAAALLNRHAGRLAKWKLTNTVKLVRELAAYFEAGGAKNHGEVVQVCEAAMVAFDRINTWIDAMIPWAHFDKKVKLLDAAG